MGDVLRRGVGGLQWEEHGQLRGGLELATPATILIVSWLREGLVYLLAEPTGKGPLLVYQPLPEPPPLGGL